MWKSIDTQHFADLAALLQQSHLDGAKGVLAADIDLDAFWEVALDCDRRIQADTDAKSVLSHLEETHNS